MKLTSLSNLPASPWEEGLAASHYLQNCGSESSRENPALSAQAKALILFLRSLEPSWARELAVEVLLTC